VVEYSTQLSIKLNKANYSDPVVVAQMKNDTSVNTFSKVLGRSIASGSISYLNSALELLMLVFYDDIMRFFDVVQNIVYIKTVCFFVVYIAIYLFIFIKFIRVLNEEIWQTHGMVNMIPTSVLQHNLRVR
jgi:hypothetical protein